MKLKRPIISSLICNTFEWYDFALYGQFSYLIGKLFFAGGNQSTQMIAAFSVFCAGYLTRPIGGITFGIIGDKYGRSKALTISIFLMALPTTCIGLLPTYAQIGITAPILLTIIRLMQGLSMGGMNGAFIFVLEHSPQNKRGLYGSLTFITTCLGILLGSIMAAIFSNILPSEQFESWGWRIPFFFSIFMGICGYFMRKNLVEAEIYLKAKLASSIQNPIRIVAESYKVKILIAMGIYITMAIPFFILAIFINNFMSSVLHFPYKHALLINLLNILIITCIVPIAGKFSDIIGRKKIMIVASLLMMILIYPIMHGINNTDLYLSAAHQFTFALLIGIYCGPLYANLAEIFPTMIRYTSLGIAMNICATLMGSMVPVIGSWLVKHHGAGSTMSYLALYVIFCNITSLVSLNVSKDMSRAKLL